MRYTAYLLVALFAIVGASATLNVIFYNSTNSQWDGVPGLYNSNNSIVTYNTINDTITTLNGTRWVLDVEAGSGGAYEASPTDGQNLRLYSSSAPSAGKTANVTLTFDLKSGKNYNLSYSELTNGDTTTFYVTIVDGYTGTQTKHVNFLTRTLGTAKKEAWLYVNNTNTSASFYYDGVLQATKDLTSFTKYYFQIGVLTDNTVNYNYRIYAPFYSTTYSAITANNFTFIPNFLVITNTTLGENTNHTGIYTGANNYNGVTTFSINFKNYWGNSSYTLDSTKTQYLVMDQAYAINNASFFLRVLDEEDLTTLVKYSLTIYNTTNTTQYGNGSSVGFFWSNWTGIPNGQITLMISNSTDYTQARSIGALFNSYPNTLGFSYVNSSVYLLKSTSGIIVNLLIRNNVGSSIPNAFVVIEKQVGGDWVIMQSLYSDSTGNAGVFLSTSSQYRIRVTATGYASFQNTVIPTTDTYTIVLSGTGVGNFTGFFYNISYLIKPVTPFLVNATSQLQDINLTVSASDGSLQYFGLNVTYSNGTLLCSSNVSSAVGGFANCTINVTALTGNPIATFFIVKTGVTQSWQKSITYQINAVFNYGWQYAVNIANQYFTPWSKLLIAILVSLGITLFFAQYVGFGSSLVLLAVLSIFSFAGFVDSITFTIVAILVGGLLITGRYGL